MSAPKFTPGPWHYDKDNPAIFNKNCLFICFAPLNNEYDIHLIAAAPDLYAELQNIANADPKKWDEDTRDQFQQWAQNRARTALAKARGEG